MERMIVHHAVEAECNFKFNVNTGFFTSHKTTGNIFAL